MKNEIDRAWDLGYGDMFDMDDRFQEIFYTQYRLYVSFIELFRFFEPFIAVFHIFTYIYIFFIQLN